MERRRARVSEAQWELLLSYLEENPSLASARGYNNSCHGRANSARHWQQLADILNAEGTGTTKSAKDWAIYVSNYKSKLKKLIAGISSDANATGGGPPHGGTLSNIENRFLAIMGPGFGQAAPWVSVNPFPDDVDSPSILNNINTHAEDIVHIEFETESLEDPGSSSAPTLFLPGSAIQAAVEPSPAGDSERLPVDAAVPVPTGGGASTLPRQTRRSRYRSRPLAPLDEARRILSQVEMQRAAADIAQAEALKLIGQNLARIATAFEIYVTRNSDN